RRVTVSPFASPVAKLAKHERFVLNERPHPDASRRRVTDSAEQARQSLVQSRIRLSLGQRGRGKGAGPGNGGCGQRFSEPRTAAFEQLELGERQLTVGACGKLHLHEIAGYDDRPQMPPAPPCDVAGDNAELVREQPC